VLVDSGVTLTIESGVEVRFVNGKALQVNGTLVARGTSTTPIIFTSNETNPSPGDWANIFFASSSIDAVFDESSNYISGSILEHCEVRYGGGSGSVGAVRIEESSPYINHCVISNSATNGISASQSSFLLSDSTVQGSAQRGSLYLQLALWRGSHHQE
jgi:hypothetical protein